MKSVKMLKLSLACVIAGLSAVAWLNGSPINKGRPATEIELIMAQGFGGYPPTFQRPMQKVLDEKAGKEDMEKLLKLCEALNKAKPPKGDVEEWKKRTGAMVSDVKEMIAGGEGAKEALVKLRKHADCKSCHDVFHLNPEEERQRVEEYKKKTIPPQK
jgi:hypothetical protein